MTWSICVLYWILTAIGLRDLNTAMLWKAHYIKGKLCKWYFGLLTKYFKQLWGIFSIQNQHPVCNFRKTIFLKTSKYSVLNSTLFSNQTESCLMIVLNTPVNKIPFFPLLVSWRWQCGQLPLHVGIVSVIWTPVSKKLKTIRNTKQLPCVMI